VIRSSNREDDMSYHDGQNVDVKYRLSTSSCMPLASLGAV
jgi:hypothetical protein